MLRRRTSWQSTAVAVWNEQVFIDQLVAGNARFVPQPGASPTGKANAAAPVCFPSVRRGREGSGMDVTLGNSEVSQTRLFSNDPGRCTTIDLQRTGTIWPHGQEMSGWVPTGNGINSPLPGELVQTQPDRFSSKKTGPAQVGRTGPARLPKVTMEFFKGTSNK